MDVETDDPGGAATGAVNLPFHRVALVGQLEREEQRIVASRTAEVQAADRHPDVSIPRAVLRLRSCPGKFMKVSRLPAHSCSSRRSSRPQDRKSTRLNSSHVRISYAVF